MATRRLLLTALGVVLAVLPFVAQTGGGPADPTGKLTTILAELARAVPQQRGAAAARVTPLSREDLPAPVRDALHGRQLRINAADEVQVYILVQSLTDETLRDLQQHGATIEIPDPGRKRVQARLPATRLQEIAALPFVTFVRLPSYAVRHIGAVTSEGDGISRASDARSRFSLDGTGVKVGVISDGLKGVFAAGCATCSGNPGGPMATGDLPASTGTRNAAGVLTVSSGGINGRSFQANSDLEGLPPPTPPCGFPGAGGEGTALLEIVHDLAPGAQLAFANADTDLAFNQAVNFLASTNDVVVDDLGFFGDAYDGTSSVSSNTAAALNNPSNRIRTYVTSVGNEADEHYLGTYTDSGVDGTTISGITQAGHLHLFQASGTTVDVLGLGPQPYNLVALARNAEIVIFLSWDDPSGRAGNNYDLYLVQQSTGKVVARSTDSQNGANDPVEFIDYVNTGAADSFRILVQNVGDGAQAKSLNLFSFGPQCAVAGPARLSPTRFERHNFNTAAMSVAAQGDAGGTPVSVISVGAICSASASAASLFGSLANPSCLDRNNGTIEFFSSRGPTLDGRIKPDIASIDGVSVTGSGSFGSPFFGTSAAAPHAAGIAALALQAAPCLIEGSPGARDPVAARTTLRDLLVKGAVALSDSAPDNTFGSGRADALRSAQQTLPVYGRDATAVAVSGNTPLGASITPDQLGFSDPSQCPLTRLTWSGGCGTGPGASMPCPFGTTRVSVGASNNGVSFGPSVELQVTVTSFSVAASPASATVDAGQAARFQVTLAPQAGPFSGSIALACGNLPPGVTCTFNPPTVTPGGAASQSAVTIATTPRSAQSAGKGVQSAESRVQSPESRVQSPECRVQGPECRVQSAGTAVESAGFAALIVLAFALLVALCTLHSGPCTLHSAPCTLHSELCTVVQRRAMATAVLLAAIGVAVLQVGCGSGGGGGGFDDDAAGQRGGGQPVASQRELRQPGGRNDEPSTDGDAHQQRQRRPRGFGDRRCRRFLAVEHVRGIAGGRRDLRDHRQVRADRGRNAKRDNQHRGQRRGEPSHDLARRHRRQRGGGHAGRHLLDHGRGDRGHAAAVNDGVARRAVRARRPAAYLRPRASRSGSTLGSRPRNAL